MFYIYTYKDDKFITVKGLKLGLTGKLEKAGYWVSKQAANTWEKTIKSKYPEAELREAILVLK